MGNENSGPRISPKRWNLVIDLLEQGKTIAEIMETTGLGKTKVYEIKRNPIRRSEDGSFVRKGKGRAV